MKFERGTAGLNVLLSVVTLLFVIGLIVMVFALMGGELSSQLPSAVAGSVGGFFYQENPDEYSDFDVGFEGCWDTGSAPFVNQANMLDNDFSTYATAGVGTGSYLYTKWYIPAGTNTTNSTFELKIGNSTGDYLVQVPLEIDPVNEKVVINTDGGGDYVFFIINFFDPNPAYILTNITGDGDVTPNVGYANAGCQAFNGNYGDIDAINNVDWNFIERIYEFGVQWNVEIAGQEGSQAKTVIEDTTSSIAGVTTWFPIIIVITAMVVLILLTVLIITAIRGSGLIPQESA